MRGCNLWLAGEKRKKEKKSWYQYVFLGFAGEDEATEEVGAIAHRQCRLIWLILHQGVRYEERAQQSPKDRSNSALGRCFGNSEALAIESKRRILNNPAKHKRGDFSTLAGDH